MMTRTVNLRVALPEDTPVLCHNLLGEGLPVPRAIRF